MLMYEKEVYIPKPSNSGSLFLLFSDSVLENLRENEIPIRFVVTRTDKDGYHCELGILEMNRANAILSRASIFNFKKRGYQNTETFNSVFFQFQQESELSLEAIPVMVDQLHACWLQCAIA